MTRWLIIVGLLLSGLAHAATPQQQAILFASSGPSLSCNFMSGSSAAQTAGSIVIGPKCPTITFTRASAETTAGYTDAAGVGWTICASGVPCFAPGLGLQIWQSATNYLLNSEVPATQTTGSLAIGTYVLFCNGTGAVLSAAITAIGSGFASLTCSLGTYQTIVITTAGTVVLTVSGTVNWFDLQGQAFPTPHILTAGATVTRAADLATVAPFSWLNAKQGTFVVGFQAPGAAVNPSSSLLTSISDGTSSNRIEMFCPIGTLAVAFRITVGGVANSPSNVPFSSGSAVKAALTYKANLGQGAVGGTVSSQTSPTAIPVTTTALYVGSSSQGTASQLNGWIRSLSYYPSTLSPATLQRVTR